MSITTFGELKSALQSWTDRSDIGDSTLSDFVTLADTRIRKDLARHEIRLREMETRDDLTPSSGACTLPDDFMAMKAVQCQASNPTVLSYRPMSWLNEAYPDGDSGTPAFYGIEGGTLYMFPLTTSDIRIVYWAYPAVLSTGNDSNWLLAKYPDIYLYAGLIELASYEQNEEAENSYIKKLSASFDGLDKSGFGALPASGLARGASAYPT